MNEWGLENVRRNHIVEASTRAWYNSVGEEVRFLLEASGSGGVTDSFLL